MAKNPSLKYWLIPLVIYGVPNLLLYWVAIYYGLIIVDMVPIKSYIDVPTSVMCIGTVALSFLLVMYCSHFGAKQFAVDQSRTAPILVGFVVFFLQLLGLMVVLWFDYGRVGGASNTVNPFATLISYLHVDAIFIAYYGHRRSKDVPFFNLLIFLVSNIVRGWSGIWLLLFFVEVYYAILKFTARKVLVYLLVFISIGLVSYPILNDYKDSARGTVKKEDASFVASVGKLLVRLQQATSTLLIAQERVNIKTALDSGEVRPFYLDNTIGSKLLGLGDNSISIQKYLSVNFLIDFEKLGIKTDLDDLGWYVHTGIAGWLFVLDWYEIPMYLLFVALLIVLPYWIAARLIGNPSIIPVLHAAALLYVFHGWFNVQIGFITGLIWYVFLLMAYKLIATTKALSRQHL
jgi:hypothetical protein